MIVVVNEREVEIGQYTTVAGLLEYLGLPDRGVAVALESSVLPRSDWATALFDGARIEIVTAVQGG
ncbi:sulfur carrier protein ThiS [Mycobacterium sp. Lab-001]|uniref:sulfur carrier protein ThiS n=1 Tax=Mycobacterium sp. Lab-001 TaxID=3410136 RepID=UPI003D170DF8